MFVIFVPCFVIGCGTLLLASSEEFCFRLGKVYTAIDRLCGDSFSFGQSMIILLRRGGGGSRMYSLSSATATMPEQPGNDTFMVRKRFFTCVGQRFGVRLGYEPAMTASSYLHSRNYGYANVP